MAAAEDYIGEDSGSSLAKDLFSGAMGGIAQVLIGMGASSAILLISNRS